MTLFMFSYLLHVGNRLEINVTTVNLYSTTKLYSLVLREGNKCLRSAMLELGRSLHTQKIFKTPKMDS